MSGFSLCLSRKDIVNLSSKMLFRIDKGFAIWESFFFVIEKKKYARLTFAISQLTNVAGSCR